MAITDRRRFLTQLLGGTAVTIAAPSWLEAEGVGGRSVPDGLEGAGSVGGWRYPGDPSLEDESYWRRVKEQFSIAPGLILMNAANLCPSPYPVQEAVFSHTRDVDRDASFQNREKFAGLREEARQALAHHVGASPSEIAITRNTSEGNNSVVNGLELGPGDEVLLWDQNHPTNNVSWDVRARRRGFSVKRVTTPAGSENPDDLISSLLSGVTGRTRVLAFSHVSNVSGVCLPARELCLAAREQGILTLVDGAQTFGAFDLDLESMGCDFFTGSSHKWFVGPKEAGLLFVREESQERLWANDVGVGWESAEANGAQKYENLGQRDDAAVAAMAMAAAFHEAIGPSVIEARVRALVSSLMDGLSAAVPGIRFHTPRSPELSGGVVVFALPGGGHREIFQALYETHRLGCAAMGGAFDGLRLSPHVYNTLEEVAVAVEAVAAQA